MHCWLSHTRKIVALAFWVVACGCQQPLPLASGYLQVGLHGRGDQPVCLMQNQSTGWCLGTDGQCYCYQEGGQCFTCTVAGTVCADLDAQHGPGCYCKPGSVYDQSIQSCVQNQSLACDQGGVCPTGYICNRANGACISQGGDCRTGQVCPTGTGCDQTTGICVVPTCKTDSDCSTLGSGAYCSDGQCQFPQKCWAGSACQDGLICTTKVGSAESFCQPGLCEGGSNYQICNNVCVNVRFGNAQHCGGCDQGACGTGQACVGGKCEPNRCSLPDVEAPCDDGQKTCVVRSWDNNNCGSCGHKCNPAGKPSCEAAQCSSAELRTTCQYGVCHADPCSYPKQSCPGRNNNLVCLGADDFKTDALNCGSCGRSCSTGQVCQQGVCANPSTCSSDTECKIGSERCCNSKCINVVSDGRNCGSCGNTCPDNGKCVDRKCETGCLNPDEGFCGGQCVNLKLRRDNCGACGNICQSGTNCIQGKCR